jgi:predicted AlkP superfamily pyrophosphatase or phosphodiesterase
MSVRDMFGIELISSIMFVDDALKDFFYEYKKRPDFGRTIFIIVGDHGISLNSGNIFENTSVATFLNKVL